MKSSIVSHYLWSSLWSVVATALVASSFAPSTLAKEYDIKIDRPLKVGHKVRVFAKASDSQNRTMSLVGREAPPHLTQKSVSLEAIEEVTAVDGGGRVKAAQFTIESVLFREGSESPESYPKGTIIKAVREGYQTAYAVDGMAINQPKSRYLDLVMGLAGGDPDHAVISEDRVFGSPRKHQVGDTWTVDKKAFREFFKVKFDPPFEFTLKAGSVTLEKVAKVHGLECLFLGVVLDLQIDSLSNFSAETEFREKSLSLGYHIILPVDTTLARVGESFSMKSTIDLSAEVKGKSISMRLVVERAHEATFKPLP